MDPYALLGVAPTASDQVISAAYHRQLKLHHPDRFTEAPPPEQQEAEEWTRRLTEAMSQIRADRASGWTSSSVVDEARGDPGNEGEDRKVDRLHRLANGTTASSVVDMAAGRFGEGRQKTPPSVERIAATAGALVVLAVVAVAIALLLVLV